MTFLPIFWRQKIAKPSIIREKLLNLLLYEKRAKKVAEIDSWSVQLQEDYRTEMQKKRMSRFVKIKLCSQFH